MKIIKTDNFNRNTVNDILIAENIDEIWGRRITDWLNENYSGHDSPDYFRLVKDDCKLHEWKP